MNAQERNQVSLDRARETLERFLAVEPAELIRALAAWYTAPPVGQFVVGRGIMDSGMTYVARGGARRLATATFLLRDSPDSPAYGLPYRARLLALAMGSRWTVEAIESQCLGCFGMGVLEGDERPCDICGAEGWGVRDIVARTDDTAGGSRASQPMVVAGVA